MIEDKEAYTVFLKIRAERGRGKAYGGGLVVGCCGGRPWQCRAHGEVMLSVICHSQLRWRRRVEHGLAPLMGPGGLDAAPPHPRGAVVAHWVEVRLLVRNSGAASLHPVPLVVYDGMRRAARLHFCRELFCLSNACCHQQKTKDKQNR